MKPPKKDEEDFESSSDDDHQHDMSALHASRSAAHHELPHRGRTRINGTAGTHGSIGVIDMDRAKNADGQTAEKQE